MRLHQSSLLLLTLFALTTGCSSMNHGDPKNPKKNPHPVKRYEVIATSEAPGPWDSVKGYITYEVANPECTPEDKFLGVHALPRGVGHGIELTRVDEKTWKGSFYGDFILDEDYFGLGVCHWKATSIGSVFAVHSETFGSGDTLDVLLAKGPQAMYFKKSEFLDRSSKNGGYGFSAVYPPFVQHPDAFFSITVSVEQLRP
jgi:hypothetical protein